MQRYDGLYKLARIGAEVGVLELHVAVTSGLLQELVVVDVEVVLETDLLRLWVYPTLLPLLVEDYMFLDDFFVKLEELP